MFLAATLLLGACKQLGFLQAEMPDDGPPVATSMEAAKRFVEKVAAAGESAVATKRLSLTITQEEVTSFWSIGSEMADQMQALNVQSLEELDGLQDSPELQEVEGLREWLELLQGREGLPQFGLSDLIFRLGLREPEVYFKADGDIIIRGYAEALGQRQPLRLVLAPQASQGELVLDFVEGQLGPASVPEVLVDQIGSVLAKLILAAGEYVEVTEVRVTDRTLKIGGAYRG